MWTVPGHQALAGGLHPPGGASALGAALAAAGVLAALAVFAPASLPIALPLALPLITGSSQTVDATGTSFTPIVITNLLFGALIVLIVLFLVGRYGNFDKGDPSLAKGFDWWGLGLMAAFLMSLQFVLEEGAKNDWFQDDEILLLAVVAGLAAWRELARPRLLLQAMVLTQQWLAVAALLVGTLLTAAYVFRVFRYSFDETAPRHDYQPLAPGMDAVALALALAALLLGLLAHWPLALLQGGGA